MQQYELPVKQAIQKVEEHVGEIKQVLPRRPLHVIPLATILLATNEVLSRHPDFKHVEKGNPTSVLSPVKNGREQYSYYELGHNLLVDRVVSKLVAEKHLESRHAEKFKTFLGRLHYNPPASLARSQQSAFEEFERELSPDHLNALLVATHDAWAEQTHELHAVHLSGKDETEVGGNLGDMFHNATSQRVLMLLDLKQLRRGMSPAEAIKLRLNKLLTIAKVPAYTD